MKYPCELVPREPLHSVIQLTSEVEVKVHILRCYRLWQMHCENRPLLVNFRSKVGPLFKIYCLSDCVLIITSAISQPNRRFLDIQLICMKLEVVGLFGDLE